MKHRWPRTHGAKRQSAFSKREREREHKKKQKQVSKCITCCQVFWQCSAHSAAVIPSGMLLAFFLTILCFSCSSSVAPEVGKPRAAFAPLPREQLGCIRAVRCVGKPGHRCLVNGLDASICELHRHRFCCQPGMWTSIPWKMQPECGAPFSPCKGAFVCLLIEGKSIRVQGFVSFAVPRDLRLAVQHGPLWSLFNAAFGVVCFPVPLCEAHALREYQILLVLKIFLCRISSAEMLAHFQRTTYRRLNFLRAAD